MVKAKNNLQALGIEGKWTEPMYDAVEKWIRRGRDQANRKAVLNGWIGLLKKRLKGQLVPADFNRVIYQMLHRAASVASLADCTKAAMAYFLFKSESPVRCACTADDIYKELRRLWDVLGKPSELPFYVVEIKLTLLPAYEPLICLERREDSTSHTVCAALQDSKNPLFRFDSFKVRQVG